MAIKNNNKGRSSECIEKRNIKLSARFYWYSNIVGLKFEKCIEYLKAEFDITESRICDLIRENNTILSGFESKKATETDLKKMFSFMNWNYKTINY
ncbi:MULTISPECIES: hypothetical protein [Elizabethkingia]|uniref:Uncharacterized protein n=1 Tax=Elizabethkingia meningoseptica TaxID=238 RepID=A0A1T3FLG2_ELIME|nr:hypothetical protein [Elizabethkingia meningoseptica]AQX13502.1 hypothetical protein BBD35_14470 [Elizabethkingia meningoseptica]MBG0515148.1 hypothetical protein [Elizabethkingia meningoseptica]MDE5434352.1 hypothetical protein [Elizabethkingia meningoseptica]OOH96212.1 hypothetical protein BMF97_07640 [Elizabethkingia meningoseptica]OPB78442.1 hypothetical protein BAY31_16985 [Elizabethkingia meningoseptica]